VGGRRGGRRDSNTMHSLPLICLNLDRIINVETFPGNRVVINVKSLPKYTLKQYHLSISGGMMKSSHCQCFVQQFVLNNSAVQYDSDSDFQIYFIKQIAIIKSTIITINRSEYLRIVITKHKKL